MDKIIDKLRLLRIEMPDPFHVQDDVKEFYSSKVGRELINSENNTINDILQYLQNQPAPELIAPAILLLAYFNPEKYYDKLLNIISQYDRPRIEALDQGIWRLNLTEDRIAHDLIRLVEDKNNPGILLLLQRPVIKQFKTNLEKFIKKKKKPLSVYAMYCYKYVEDEMDLDFLKSISESTNSPELASLAREYLRRS
jgi:hypothetical protein